MNAPSMESVFLLLSGAVLAAGVLYWFWSHIQLTQKKVQLLENAVFELRGMLTPPPPPPHSASPSSSETGDAPIYNDLADDDDDEEDWSKQPASTPLEALVSDNTDLQPGGRAAGIDLTVTDEKEPTPNAQFRELFIQHEQRVPTPVVAKEVTADQSLESMPVKELRRLAEQRGITGISDMKKKELLSALRQQVAMPPPSLSDEKEETVKVERTLDLTEDATVLE